MRISNRGLAKIAAVGGFFVLGSAGFFKWKLSNNIKQSEYFQLAVKSLIESEAVVGFLGQPVLFGSLDLGDSANNHCDGLLAKFSVPVRGPKNTGRMDFEASRSAFGDPWHLDKLEFIDKEATKKLVIISRSSITASKE